MNLFIFWTYKIKSYVILENGRKFGNVVSREDIKIYLMKYRFLFTKCMIHNLDPYSLQLLLIVNILIFVLICMKKQFL